VTAVEADPIAARDLRHSSAPTWPRRVPTSPFSTHPAAGCRPAAPISSASWRRGASSTSPAIPRPWPGTYAPSPITATRSRPSRASTCSPRHPT
jgi:hypothetical protein